MPQKAQDFLRWHLSLLALLLATILSSVVLAQNPQANALTKDQVSKKALEDYRTGVDAGNKGDRRNAERYLKSAIEREPAFVDAVVELGSIYYAAGEYVEAERYLEQAAGFTGRAGYEALYGLAMTELKLEKAQEAADHLETYLAKAQPREDRKKAAEDFRADALFRAQALANPVNIQLTPLPASINTPADAEYLPALTADGQTLVFTRRVGNRQEDFYASQRVDGVWQEAAALPGVNTPDNEGAQSVSADGRYLVFTACGRKDGLGSCDLYFSQLVNGQWTPAQNLGAPINTKAWESQPSLSANGELLFFSSKNPEGQGGADLYAAGRSVEGRWSMPINLGAVVNSGKDDQAPFFHADGRTLYFMSNGRPGMGGFDLYMTRLGDDQIWSKPENLGYPLNTKSNEGALAVALDGKTAYFATDLKADSSVAVSVGGMEGAATDLYTFELPSPVRAGQVTYLRAKVVNALTDAPIGALAILADASNEKPFLRRRARAEDGTFLAVLPSGKTYSLSVEEPGYAFYSDRFELLEAASASQPFELEIRLQPLGAAAVVPDGQVVESEPIVLRNVLFATGSAELLPASKAELDRLRGLLESNAALRIRLQGHTDDVGDEAANQTLSQRRAEAVKKYLVAAGIAADRLSAAGFGESRPQLEGTDTESRRLNRRTEFVILQR